MQPPNCGRFGHVPMCDSSAWAELCRADHTDKGSTNNLAHTSQGVGGCRLTERQSTYQRCPPIHSLTEPRVSTSFLYMPTWLKQNTVGTDQNQEGGCRAKLPVVKT